jgi:hypothetical protein
VTAQAFKVVPDSEQEPVNRIRVKYGLLFDALLEGRTVRLPFDGTDPNALRATWQVANKGTGKHVHIKRNGEAFIAWADESKGCAK